MSMLKLMALAVFAVAALPGCNSGQVYFDGRNEWYDSGDSSGYDLQDVDLHPLPELQSPSHDFYSHFGEAGFPSGGGISYSTFHDIWFIPKVAGARVIRRYAIGYQVQDEKATQGHCSLRLEYNVAGERECGDRRRCLQLELAVTHAIPVGGLCDERPPLQTLEVIEDLNEQKLRYPPDLSEGLEDEVEQDTAIAWRRSVAPRWSPITARGAPPPLRLANAYTVGERVLVFGTGVSGGFKGAWYDMPTGKWVALPTENAPVFSGFGAWTWTGDRLLVVTAGKATWLKDNVWEAAPVEGLPNYAVDGAPGCVRMAATNKEILIWGSKLINDEPISSGAVLDLDGTAWRNASSARAPNARCYSEIGALGTEFMVVGSDGGQSIYYPQGTGAWSPAPVLSDDSPVLLDTFMWGDAHTAIYRDSGSDWLLSKYSATNHNWVVNREIYRFGMGTTNVGKNPVLFGGLHEDWGDTNSDDTMVVINDGMLIFSEDTKRLPLVLPMTDHLGWRAKPLVAYVQPDKLFVWGGCTNFVNHQCTTFSDTGAVLTAVLGN